MFSQKITREIPYKYRTCSNEKCTFARTHWKHAGMRGIYFLIACPRGFLSTIISGPLMTVISDSTLAISSYAKLIEITKFYEKKTCKWKKNVTSTSEHRKGRDVESLVHRRLLPIPFRSTTITSGRIIMAITDRGVMDCRNKCKPVLLKRYGSLYIRSSLQTRLSTLEIR